MMFVCKFKYDNGAAISSKIAIVTADTKEEATDLFNQNIHRIFSHSDDVCQLVAVRKIPDDTKIITTTGNEIRALGDGGLMLW